jgi:hypothetical protein
MDMVRKNDKARKVRTHKGVAHPAMVRTSRSPELARALVEPDAMQSIPEVSPPVETPLVEYVPLEGTSVEQAQHTPRLLMFL